MTSIRSRLPLLLLAALGLAASPAAAEVRSLLVAPHDTDARLAEGESQHAVRYDPALADAPLLVWLPGTGGQSARGPRELFDTVLRQGHRLISLSYLNTPAVSQVCVGPRLRERPDCAQRMRQQRVWGEPQTGLISDRPEDAIVPRLTQLLRHLEREDAAGQWAQYLDGEAPRWSRIVLAGQSQGGGMAAFLAQTRAVAGVISFSGGWDRASGRDEIAGWYGRASQTPAARWHATYHVEENQADLMARSYQRLGIPAAQVHALALPVRGNGPHGEGISNPAYRELWERMLRPADTR